MIEMFGKISEISAKEIASKGSEKIKGTVEKLDVVDEIHETSDHQNKIALMPDVETAKNSSLARLLKDNRNKRETYEIKTQEIDEGAEGKEGKEGLTDVEKEKLRELTGWSDDILEAIGSMEEAEIYMKAGLKEVEINGKKCLIRDDIDLDQTDEDGISNRDRMERGRPPITKDGEEVELHHIGQKQSSPLAELTMEQHRGVGNDTILHDKTKETEIDRNEFGKERREHWKDRVESMKGAE